MYNKTWVEDNATIMSHLMQSLIFYLKKNNYPDECHRYLIQNVNSAQASLINWIIIQIFAHKG